MIDFFDTLLLRVYTKPLPLLAVTLTATLIGLGLFLLAPQADQDSVFYWPLTTVHQIGLIAAVIGMTVSLIFFAQHYSPLQSLALFAFVGVLIFGALSFITNDDFRDVQHHDTVRIGNSVYRLGYVRSAELVEDGRFLLQSYIVYKCGTLGIFCDVIGRDIVPSLNRTQQLQNLAVIGRQGDRLLVLDGGDATQLFDYTP